MIKYLKEYRFYIILFLFVLIPIIAIDTSQRAPREYRFYDRVLVGMTAPIQAGITWTLDTLISSTQNYLYLWHVRSDNGVLLEENRRLLTTIVNLQEIQKENERLRQLLAFREQFKLETVVARVIARDVSNEFRSLRINRGEASGIHKNMAVIDSQGVIGRVWRTTEHTADVVTILDLLSAVDAIVARSRARGVVEGLTDELAQLKFTIRTDDIQEGDLLITSGLGDIFPKGIAIGTVSRVEKKPYGITQYVELRPSVDFSRIEELMVITRFQTTPTHLVEGGSL